MPASLSGKRPFRAEMQLMRKRSSGPARPSPTEESLGAPGLASFELREILDAFRQELLEDVRAVVRDGSAGGAGGPDTAVELGELQAQVRELSASIKLTKDELTPVIRTSDANQRIDVMRSELRDVVTGQETATGSILDCVEMIEEIAQRIKEDAGSDGIKNMVDGILDNVVQVFEHCNFQDLSGQRIAKVINTLNFIEERIDAIVAIWGEDEFAANDVAQEPTGQDDLDRVLAKPTDENQRISQDEIDKMFE